MKYVGTKADLITELAEAKEMHLATAKKMNGADKAREEGFASGLGLAISSLERWEQADDDRPKMVHPPEQPDGLPANTGWHPAQT